MQKFLSKKDILDVKCSLNKRNEINEIYIYALHKYTKEIYIKDIDRLFTVYADVQRVIYAELLYILL